MKHALIVTAALLVSSAAVYSSTDPLVGTWRLDHQEVNGQPTNSEPLTLKITEAGDKLAFAFSVPVNDVYFVSMSYTVKLDGSEGDVKNAKGDKVGTVEMTPAGPSQYKIVLKGPNRPDSTGRLTISADGKTLTSEQNTAPNGPSGRATHSKQLFTRY